MVVANEATDELVVLLAGDGALFESSTKYAVGDGPTSIATGDFDGDGSVDLAVANAGTDRGLPSVSVLLNAGDGTFHQAIDFHGFRNPPERIVAGDPDRDGDDDLVVSMSGDADLALLVNRGATGQLE